MEQQGLDVLGRTIPAEQITFRRFGDLRYRLQGYDIRVPIPSGELGPESESAVREAFERVYQGLYGQSLPELAIDIVNWRVIAQGPKPELALLGDGPSKGGGDSNGLKGRREAYMPESNGFVGTAVYDRYRLVPGQTFDGPAIVEERESTVVIGPKARARVDDALSLLVDMHLE
jgi:N-methylhydantoinase A